MICLKKSHLVFTCCFLYYPSLTTWATAWGQISQKPQFYSWPTPWHWVIKSSFFHLSLLFYKGNLVAQEMEYVRGQEIPYKGSCHRAWEDIRGNAMPESQYSTWNVWILFECYHSFKCFSLDVFCEFWYFLWEMIIFLVLNKNG